MFFLNAILATSLYLVTFSAQAFPVIMGGMASNIVVLFLSLIGLRKSSKENNKSLFVFFLLILAFLGYQHLKNSETQSLALEHMYFPGNIDKSTLNDYLLADGKKSLQNLRSGNADYIIVSSAKTLYVPGSHIIYFNDKEAIAAFAKQTDKPVYIFSNYREQGIKVASELKNYGVSLSSVIDSGALFDDINRDQLLGVTNYDKDIKYRPISTNFKSVSKVNESANQIVITDASQLKVHAFMGAFLLTPYDIASMRDEQWLNIRKEMDPNLPIRINFSYGESDKNIKALSGYIANKLDTSLKNMSYSKTISTALSNDNQITPIFYKSDQWLDTIDVYALTKKLDSTITIGCFTEQCIERTPPRGSGYLSRNVKQFNPFFMENWKLQVGDIPFSKHEQIILSPEDSNTTLLSFYLGYELDKRGYQFNGFAKDSSELFGSAFFLGEGQGLLFDSSKIDLLIALNELLDVWASHEPFNVDNATLFVVGALIGLLALLGGGHSIVAAMLSAWIFSYFSSVFRLPVEEYQNMLVTPYTLTYMFLGYLFFNFYAKTSSSITYWKVFAIGLFSSFFLFSAFSFIPTPYDRIYLGAITAMSLKAVLDSLIKNITYTPFMTGDKYTKTIPFLGDRLIRNSFIIKPGTKNIPFLARGIGLTKFIIRSNHITPEEQSSAGLYETRVVKGHQLAEAIKDMKKTAAESIDISKIQFWVMPYLTFKQKGVAKSHAPESSFSISYSLDEKDSVTEGHSSHYAYFRRDTKKTRIERQIMSLIEEVEQYYDKPVIIEFGYTAFNQIKLLQVRIDEQVHSAFHQQSLSLWRSGHRFANKVESSLLSPLGRSITSALYDYSIIMDHQYAYRVREATKPLEYMNLLNAFIELKNIHFNIDNYINRVDLNSFVQIVANIVKPISNCSTKHKLNVDHDDIASLLIDVSNFMKITGGTIGSMDIIDPWRSLNMNIHPTQRDACKLVMMLSVVICKHFAEKSGLVLNKNLSLSSYTEGKPAEPLQEIESKMAGWVIVSGKMPSLYLNIDNYMNVAKKDLKKYTLVVESFPVSDMNLVSQLGGVISRDGSPMSHLAITAKQCKTPCLIGANYYDSVNITKLSNCE